MNNKFFYLLAGTAVALFTGATLAAAGGSISLDKTAGLAAAGIPLPDGKPQPLLALAMRHGTAKGYFSGAAAQAIKTKFGQEVPIFVTATKLEPIKNKPGCNKVQLTFKASEKFAASYPEQSLLIAVCPQ